MAVLVPFFFSRTMDCQEATAGQRLTRAGAEGGRRSAAILQPALHTPPAQHTLLSQY